MEQFSGEGCHVTPHVKLGALRFVGVDPFRLQLLITSNCTQTSSRQVNECNRDSSQTDEGEGTLKQPTALYHAASEAVR